MGSFIELNDTLQISNEQGFPINELNVEKHLITPYKTEDFEGRIFEFKNKQSIRVYKSPPVRNFFVQNIGGKWVYWGLVHIIEITHDYINKTTSGKYKIIHINSPEEMKQAYSIVDRRNGMNYFE